MKTLWNSNDRDALLARFAKLSPEARPRWGSMTAPRMIAHVTDALRAGLDEVAVVPKRSPIAIWPMNTLVMFYLPWPKGAPTAPELLDRTPADWETEIGRLRSAMERFTARDVDGAWPRHAAFGAIGGANWGRLSYRHMDHHLTQFGV